MSDHLSGALLLETPQYCPDCHEVLEHTGDKLYYCRGCATFSLALDGAMQTFLLDAGEPARRDLQVVSTVPL